MKRGKIIIVSLLIIACVLTILGLPIEYSSATLRKFGSYSELKSFLQYRNNNFPWRYASLLEELKVLYSLDYSQTNIQVEGVDEADIVKTDGEYLYIISGQALCIVKAYPPEDAELLSKITIENTLKQIFVNQEKLVIFSENSTSIEPETSVKIYDISDKENPVLENEIIVDGIYFTSRMINQSVYLITRKGAYIHDGEVNLPEISINGESKIIHATEIYYSDTPEYSQTFTMITAINIVTQEVSEETILSGWSTEIYVSKENVYLAIRNYGKTLLHRIHLENGEISYVANGQVLGRVLNQFSMDEYNEYFRIATTSRTVVSVSEDPFGAPKIIPSIQENNVYILNMDLAIISSIKGIAPGETIHSARFMGDICYLVTFRKVDPFFVIDLSDPYNPKILGELKITGYSDYLHPYDENHMIGIGKETIAEQGDFSWYQGVKISLFDVSNYTDPKELAKYEIGDRGTDSPVLRDHKAFLFDKERKLMVIPVLVAKIDEEQYPNGVPPYVSGRAVWQGAYVFKISPDLDPKIVLLGTITHIENGNLSNTSLYIVRSLYIEDVLYTVSESMVMMNSLQDLILINVLDLNE